MRCTYCGGKCVDYYLRSITVAFESGLTGIMTDWVNDDRPHCVDCGARPMGPEVTINPDFTAEELATGWYRGTYTLEETFR